MMVMMKVRGGHTLRRRGLAIEGVAGTEPCNSASQAEIKSASETSFTSGGNGKSHTEDDFKSLALTKNI